MQSHLPIVYIYRKNGVISRVIVRWVVLVRDGLDLDPGSSEKNPFEERRLGPATLLGCFLQPFFYLNRAGSEKINSYSKMFLIEEG